MVIDPANHDDNTNEDDFLEMEKEILGRYGDDVWHSQIQTILKSWFPKLRQNARDEGSDKVNCKFYYQQELLDAEDLISDIKSALFRYRKDSYGIYVSDKEEKEKREEYEKNTKGVLWSVLSDFELHNRPDEWRSVSPVDKSELESVLVRYLKKDWLQHNAIDWAVINALLFHETAHMNEDIKSGYLFGKINWAYVRAGGDVDKLAWATIKLVLSAFAMRWIIPPAVIGGLLYTGYPGSAAAVGGLWSLYLLYRLITISHRRRESKEAEKDLQEYLDILKALITAWQFANTEVINPTRLKEFVVAAEDKGAMLSPVVHSLLDRAIQRDPAVFIISGN